MIEGLSSISDLLRLYKLKETLYLILRVALRLGQPVSYFRTAQDSRQCLALHSLSDDVGF